MWVEAGHHAANGLLDQLLIAHRLDIIVLDARKHFGEDAQLIDRDRGFRIAIGSDIKRQGERDTDGRTGTDPRYFLPLCAHHMSLEYLLCSLKNNGNRPLSPY